MDGGISAAEQFIISPSDGSTESERSHNPIPIIRLHVHYSTLDVRIWLAFSSHSNIIFCANWAFRSKLSLRRKCIKTVKFRWFPKEFCACIHLMFDFCCSLQMKVHLHAPTPTYRRDWIRCAYLVIAVAWLKVSSNRPVDSGMRSNRIISMCIENPNIRY